MAGFKTKSIFQLRTAVGTAVVQLCTTTGYVCKHGFEVLALPGNTATVYVEANSSVSSSTGYPMVPGQSRRFLSTDPSTFYTLGAAASQAVHVVGE